MAQIAFGTISPRVHVHLHTRVVKVKHFQVPRVTFSGELSQRWLSSLDYKLDDERSCTDLSKPVSLVDVALHGHPSLSNYTKSNADHAKVLPPLAPSQFLLFGVLTDTNTP